MDINKLTQNQLLAAEGYFTLATMVGKILQTSVYILDHPDYRPKVMVYNGEPPEIDDSVFDDQEDEEPEKVSTESVYSGRIKSGELSIDNQIEQATCLFDQRIRKLVGDLPLYDMFHFASSLFDYDPQGFGKDGLSPLNKRKAAVAWVITKRAYAVFHMEEALHFLNIPDVLIGDITLNAPLASRKMDDIDREFIARACGLCAEIIDNNVPLQDLIDAAIDALEKGDKSVNVNRLPLLASIPNGEAVNWFISVINGFKGGRFVEGNARNRHEKITRFKDGDNLRFMRDNNQSGSKIFVDITNVSSFTSKTNKTLKKMMLFSLQKMIAQNFPSKVCISFQELVDRGIYSTTQNAYRAFKDFFSKQKQVELGGTVSKNGRTINEKGGILFYSYEYIDGCVYLAVNKDFNMDFIANFFSVFPLFAYTLSDNAFDIVWYIFYLARQNKDLIKANGRFNINLESVRSCLGLPDPETVKNKMNRRYKQLIITPIEDAIEEIENALATVPEAKDYGFTITPIVADTSNILEWLQGYLEIGLRGDFAEKFIDIAIKAEAEQEKRLKAKTAAIAKLEAKKELAKR